MSFNPYLNFDGTCREAMTFYAGVFGATDLSVMSFGDTPDNYPKSPETAALVMHSQFTTGPGAVLYASDVPPGMEWSGHNGTIYHSAPTTDRARAVFDALAEGGTVWMPLAETFWAPLFGGLTDRFGVSWMVSLDAAAT
jgi:PhnB protein